MDDQAATLELLVERLEKDVDEWRHLSGSDLDSSANEELEAICCFGLEGLVLPHFLL